MFQGGTGRTTGAVLSLAFDSNGTILWTGDEKVWYGIWLWDLCCMISGDREGGVWILLCYVITTCPHTLFYG